jgi:hypothetical protein
VSAALYMPLLDAIRRCGMSAEELEPFIVNVNGSMVVSVATVERLRAARLPLAKAEQDEYHAGRLDAGERKY